MITTCAAPSLASRPAALFFFNQALRAPGTTGAVVPSGPALARALTAPVQERAHTDLRVLEVGAGSGPVTRGLLRLLTPGSRLDIVEANGAFVPGLSALAATGRARTRVHHARIQDADLETDYDVIVSALPFTNFPLAEVTGIVDLYRRRTRPGGVITWFAYRGSRTARALTASTAEAARHRAVHHHLTRQGGSATTVWANIPPARVTRLRPHG